MGEVYDALIFPSIEVVYLYYPGDEGGPFEMFTWQHLDGLPDENLADSHNYRLRYAHHARTALEWYRPSLRR